VFGATADRPFSPSAAQSSADAAWEDAGLARITTHACRHLYASTNIAAGVNAHALCRYMGHSSINVTFDLYGHLFPGNEAEAACSTPTLTAPSPPRPGSQPRFRAIICRTGSVIACSSGFVYVRTSNPPAPTARARCATSRS
jgi:hypothetical protein